MKRLSDDNAKVLGLILLSAAMSLAWLVFDDLVLIPAGGGVAPNILLTVLKNSTVVLVAGGCACGLLCRHVREARRMRHHYETMQQHLRQARDEWEERVQEQTAELLTMNRTLEQRIAAHIQTGIARRDSEERFRQLAEHIREVFWVYGIAEERILYVSPAYEEIWGRSVESFYERPLDWLEAIHPDDRERIYAAHINKRYDGYLDVECRIVRPDGSSALDP